MPEPAGFLNDTSENRLIKVVHPGNNSTRTQDENRAAMAATLAQILRPFT